MKRTEKSNAHVFINLILPYACVLLVPILIWWISNFYVMENNEQRMLALVKSSLENNINMVDANLNQVEDVIYRLSQNTAFQDFYEKEEFTFHEITDLQRTLASNYIEDGLTDKLYMYSARAGCLIDNSTFYPEVEDFLVSYFPAELDTLEERKADFEERIWHNGYRPQTSFNVNRVCYPFVSYSRTMPLNYPNRKYGSITALVNVDKLLSCFDSILSEGNGEIYVLSKNGEVIMQRGEVCREKILSGEKSKLFYRNVKIGGRKMYQFTLDSAQKSWQYHIFLDRDYIMRDMVLVKGLLSAVNILALVLGVLLCIYFTYGRNKSYQRIMHMLGIDKKPIPILPLKTNEFEFWNPYIGSLLDENRQIKENMNKLSSQSDYKVLHLLFSGPEDETKARRLVEESGISFAGRYYMVLVLRSGAVYNLEGESNKNIFLSHAVEEFLEGEPYIYIADAKTMAVLMSFDVEPRVFSHRLKKRLVNMNLEVFHRYRMEVVMGVGSVAKSLCDIAESYRQGLEVIAYNQLTGTKERLFYEELPLEQAMYYYPLEVENGLITTISAGKAPEAVKILNAIYEENFTKRSLSANRIGELLREIYSTLNKVRQTYFKDEERKNYRLEDFTIKSFFEYARDFVFAACENVRVFEEDSYNEQFKEMLEYIQENYSCNDLSRDTLAEAFGLTDSTYISKKFKKYMDETFSSYLERIRMEKACELLDSRMPVKDVAEAVGYLSDISFRRVFKKRMGMSPSEYIGKQKNI